MFTTIGDTRLRDVAERLRVDRAGDRRAVRRRRGERLRRGRRRQVEARARSPCPTASDGDGDQHRVKQSGLARGHHSSYNSASALQQCIISVCSGPVTVASRSPTIMLISERTPKSVEVHARLDREARAGQQPPVVVRFDSRPC